MKVIYLLLSLFVIKIQLICSENNGTTIDNRQSLLNCCNNVQIWSKLLEDYTISKTHRTPKILQTSHRYIPTSGIYITKRIGDAMELEPHMRRPPGKVILPQNHNQQQQEQQNFHNSNRQSYGQDQPFREVTETDLYLLGAIEKLVYRVDYLESRLRRAEQMIYYITAGNKQKEIVQQCPFNFTRIGDICYHIAGDMKINWKSANNACKILNSHLAEFENLSEMEEMIAFLLNHPLHRGKDFWVGGLNPGLLWIWSNSAKPVNPNTNLTSVANTANTSSTTATFYNKTRTDHVDSDNEIKDENRILNNSIEIKGNGRCLRLSYNPSKHSYNYYGQECTSRHHYICEYEDRSLDNKINKIAKELNL